MKTKALSIIALMAVAVFVGSASFANVPPPPVNQLIGVDDTLFNDQTEAQCRACHTETIDMHHMLYGSAMPAAGNCTVISPARPCLSNNTCDTPPLSPPVCNMGGTACPVGTCSITNTTSCIVDSDCPSGEVCNAGDCPNFRSGEVCGQPYCPVGSAVVDDDVGNNGIDTNYGCLNCHEQQVVGGVITFVVTRDCLVCHVQNPNSPTIHHRDGGDAKAGRCSTCHGDIVDNIEGCRDTFCGTDRGATTLVPCASNNDCTALLVPQKLCRVTGATCTVNGDCPTIPGECSISGASCTVNANCPAGQTCVGAITQTCVNQLWCGYYGPGGTETCTDGHEIPTYTPSMVTPDILELRHACSVSLTTCQENADCPAGERCAETTQQVAGGCAYCHNEGIDTVSGVDVFNNHDTHHDIFLHKTNAGGTLSNVCSWCHESGYPHVPNGEEPTRIRWCENCHGYESLHNIQADSPKSPTGTIVVGGEDAYWGHIGKDNPANPNGDSDCWGCHGFSPLNGASAPGTGAIIPSLAGISVTTVTAGAEAAITLTGTAFTNITGTTQYTPNVEVTAADGSATIVTPDAISVDSLMATIPALSAGTYDIRVVKDTVKSNPIAITCVPKVEITSVVCANGALTVTGSGFGDQPPAGAEEFINCKLDGIALEIVSWSETQIVAATTACGESVTVNALYGSASYGAAASPCSANFDDDEDVDGSDASAFKGDFGRSSMISSCENGTPCNGDFDCDHDVDGSDASGFKAQFGRGRFTSPCAVVPNIGCSY